jgi:4-amino-4-deoxy-L-arabinose transferase-like glycosyltransferase
MLVSWHNFFFASYDAGFVSVDKPALGFWIQAASAYLFSFHGWSLLLPQALVLWGTWLISLVVFFSVAGDWDPHYLAMLAPAVAALVGARVVPLWDNCRSAGWRGWLLPLTLVGTASLQLLHILAHYPEWSPWLVPTIVSLCLAAAASLVVARLGPQLRINGYPLNATAGHRPSPPRAGRTGAAPPTTAALQGAPQGHSGHPRKEEGEVDNGQQRAG